MKKPVPAYTLPSGTFGMAPDRLTVFGSAASRAVPEGVTYQRLRHPDDVPMAEVLDVEVFDGKLYVIAEFTDGTIHHFYGGALVAAGHDGVAREAWAGLAALAAPRARYGHTD